jgi:hypothetical protein
MAGLQPHVDRLNTPHLTRIWEFDVGPSMLAQLARGRSLPHSAPR